jgi:hypothetical protein
MHLAKIQLCYLLISLIQYRNNKDQYVFKLKFKHFGFAQAITFLVLGNT